MASLLISGLCSLLRQLCSIEQECRNLGMACGRGILGGIPPVGCTLCCRHVLLTERNPACQLPAIFVSVALAPCQCH